MSSPVEDQFSSHSPAPAAAPNFASHFCIFLPVNSSTIFLPLHRTRSKMLMRKLFQVTLALMALFQTGSASFEPGRYSLIKNRVKYGEPDGAVWDTGDGKKILPSCISCYDAKNTGTVKIKNIKVTNKSGKKIVWGQVEGLPNTGLWIIMKNNDVNYVTRIPNATITSTIKDITLTATFKFDWKYEPGTYTIKCKRDVTNHKESGKKVRELLKGTKHYIKKVVRWDNRDNTRYLGQLKDNKWITLAELTRAVHPDGCRFKMEIFAENSSSLGFRDGKKKASPPKIDPFNIDRERR